VPRLRERHELHVWNFIDDGGYTRVTACEKGG
jgi:hypothetical protein